MRGFTDKALILFPKAESMTDYTLAHKYKFDKCVQNIVALLKENGITPCCLSNDEVAVTYNVAEEWWSTDTPEDRFFYAHNCEGVCVPPMQITEDEELITAARKAYRIPKDLEDIQKRFDLALKRTKYIEKKLIRDCKLIFYFKVHGNPSYTVSSLEEDGRIIAYITPATLTCKTFLSSREVSNTDMFGDTANKPVYEWR